MSFSSWLRNRKRSAPAEGRRSHVPSRQRPTYRPRLEVLEGRHVPSTLTVTNNLDIFAPGSLRTELLVAQPSDTIVFAPSLNGQTITLDAQLEITKNLTIQGPGAGQLAISGGNSSRVFDVAANTNVTLSGLEITGGTGGISQGSNNGYDGYGGGILNFGTLTLSGCTVSNNSVGFLANSAVHYGGGIYNAGTLTITNSTVSGNSAGYGTLFDSIGSGGGIYNVGTLTVTGSTLSGNSATYQGGGIFNEAFNSPGTVTVSGSTLSGNSATYQGGGIFNAGTVTVSGSTLSGNSATFGGGGIFNDKHAQLTISNKTVVCDNVAPSGADLFNLGSAKISKDSTVCVIGH
jgi:predicted outer membrane repeat protein